MERLESMNSVDPEGLAFSPAPSERGARKRGSTSKLTDWQRFFLMRLEYLLDVQRGNPPAEADQASLMSKAVYSTFLDCQTQGVGDEALQRIAASSSAQPSAN
ncbi:MAG TPA: hypothetical protein VIR57_06125 [Chloroflexota bacterium]|jgi:hypothetical protein